MKLMPVVIVAVLLALGAEIYAQTGSTIMSGTTNLDQSCASADGKRKGVMSYDDAASWRSQMAAFSCKLYDGAPPRFIAGPTANSDTGSYPHWECDDGYELDGLIATWKGGIFTPAPERCKANP